jgi:hypothetical protein
MELIWNLFLTNKQTSCISFFFLLPFFSLCTFAFFCLRTFAFAKAKESYACASATFATFAFAKAKEAKEAKVQKEKYEKLKTLCEKKGNKSLLLLLVLSFAFCTCASAKGKRKHKRPIATFTFFSRLYRKIITLYFPN